MRILARLVAVTLLLLVALLAVAGMIAPWSPWGWLGLGVATIAALALLVAKPRARRGLGAVAGTLLMTLLGVRLVGAERGTIRMITLPAGTPSRWIGRIVDEQDVSLLGARLLAARWHLPPVERERLVPAMREAYAEMRRDDAVTPSPAPDTVLGRQGPGAFDTLVIEPPRGRSAQAGVVFLHGYTGSFTLECWLVAAAARAIDAITVCPATGFAGHWSGHDGERMLRATLHYVQARGVTRVYLAGLSNGAVGASALAPRYASSLAGLVLISGAPSAGGSGGLPVLVLHGSDDPIASAATARAFAARTNASYVGLDAGHFALLVRRAEAREAITAWLRQEHDRGAP
jgi:pimeloyl-ACP methyl ester carboxylesterase